MVKKPTTNGCSCPNSLITPLNTFLLRLGQEILWLCHCTTRNLWQGGTNVLERKVDCKGWISIQFSIFSMIFPSSTTPPSPFIKLGFKRCSQIHLLSQSNLCNRWPCGRCKPIGLTNIFAPPPWLVTPNGSWCTLDFSCKMERWDGFE